MADIDDGAAGLRRMSRGVGGGEKKIVALDWLSSLCCLCDLGRVSNLSIHLTQNWPF